MNAFTIKLGSITNGKNIFSFEIRDQFFKEFSFTDIKFANVSALATIEKDGEKLALNLSINGKLNKLPCDICTDDLTVMISGETNIILKKTEKDLVSTDEIYYIKSSENKLDLKQLIFESIILNAPKKRQHPFDENGNTTCDKEMIDLVKKYTQVTKKTSDSRWDALKNIK